MGQVEQWRHTSWKRPKRRDSDGRCEISRSRDAAGKDSSKSGSCQKFLDLDEGSKHLKWTHLEQVKHCTNLPKLHYRRTLNRERRGQG